MKDLEFLKTRCPIIYEQLETIVATDIMIEGLSYEFEDKEFDWFIYFTNFKLRIPKTIRANTPASITLLDSYEKLFSSLSKNELEEIMRYLTSIGIVPDTNKNETFRSPFKTDYLQFLVINQESLYEFYALFYKHEIW